MREQTSDHGRDGLPAQKEPLVLRLRGSQAEMGRQFGTYCSEAGRHEAALQLYADRPTMAARMVAAGLPFAVRHGVERAADAVFAVQRRRLHRERTRRFPEFVARTEAGFEPLGRSDADVDAVFVMDVLQNAVGTIGRTSMFHHAEVAAAAMCSSVAVWGGATTSGDLLHARNFDFPGATIWDLAPTIVFCEPVDGLRYGFVTTNGVDAPGITCWNEAGLTLTVHTRFHRDVRWSGPSVIDLGHEIIRSSDTIEAAVACARRLGASSSWGLLISSAAERSAVVVELAGPHVALTEPGPAEHLSCTNRYLDAGLRRREVTTSHAFALDSDNRFAQLEAFVAKQSGGIDADALEDLLGDYGAPGLVDRSDDVVRLSGTSVVSPVSVASIVADPAEAVMRVSVGRAPSGLGPYLRVPWSWDGEVGIVAEPGELGPRRGRTHRGEPVPDHHVDVAHRFSSVVQGALDRDAPHVVRAGFVDLCDRVPTEPGFHAMAAYLAVLDGDLDDARTHLDVALGLEGTPVVRAQLLLTRSRVHAAAGRPDAATADRTELASITEPAAAAMRAAAAAEVTRPLSLRRLRLMSPDVMLLDLHA